jgi:non-specific protein-tyrosine kinase
MWNVMMAAALGLALALGAIFLLEYLDDTIKSGDDVQRALSLPTLGAISRMTDIVEPGDHLVTLNHPRSSVSEAYRVLRTNLQFSSLGNPAASLLITSASPAEGKTTTAANLAVAMAQAGKRVILVDTDLRRPALHKMFDVSIAPGLTNLLIDPELAPEDVMVHTSMDGLFLLPSGPIPPNPAELLASPQMVKLLEQLTAQADAVICDSPPLLAVADSSILAAEVGGTLLVINSGRTRTEYCRRAKETLEKVGAHVLGVALNKMSGKEGGGYYYYYYYARDDGKSGGERKREE